MTKNRLYVLGLLMVVLLGCQPLTTTYYKGASAADMGVVRLSAEKSEQQRWQDLYATVDYNLETNGDLIDIDGVLSFSQNPRGLYTQVPDFKLKMFFLDRYLRVVSYLDIARTLSSSLDDETRFRKSFRPGPDAVAFTFGYEGRFYDSDPEHPSSDMVWKLPKRNE